MTFWGKPGLIRRDGVHPTRDGAALISRNLSDLIRLPLIIQGGGLDAELQSDFSAASPGLDYWIRSYWIRSYWIRGYWIRSYWIRGYWIRSYWIRGYWIRGYWIRSYWICKMERAGFSVVNSPPYLKLN